MVESLLQSSLADSSRPVESSCTQPRIVDLFRVPGRYLRSAHLEHDFDDTESLRDYVLTPPMIAVLARMIDGLRPGSGRRKNVFHHLVKKARLKIL